MKEVETIIFKSNPEYYWREKEGIKNHTERIPDEPEELDGVFPDKRFVLLFKMMNEDIPYGKIRIVNSGIPTEFFERQITDIARWNDKVDLWMITWKVPSRDEFVTEYMDDYLGAKDEAEKPVKLKDVDRIIEDVKVDENLPDNEFNMGRMFGRQSFKQELKKKLGSGDDSK